MTVDCRPASRKPADGFASRRVALAAVLLCGLLAQVAGCGGGDGPERTLVLWKDASGEAWWAPLRTPREDDPVWDEHPGAGVVLRCPKTGEETLVANPDDWVARHGDPNSPYRSRVGAPLILPPENRRTPDEPRTP